MKLVSRSVPNVKLTSRSAGARLAYPGDDVGGPVPGDHPHHDPTESLQHFRATNIPAILTPVAAMMITVVLDRDFQVLPTHIEVGHRVAKVINDPDLRLWWR